MVSSRGVVLLVLACAVVAGVGGWCLKQSLDNVGVERSRKQAAAVAEAQADVQMAVTVYRQTRAFVVADSVRGAALRDSLQYTIDSLIWVVDSTAGGSRPMPMRVTP